VGSVKSKSPPPPQLEPVRGDQIMAGSCDLSTLTALSGEGEEPGGQEIVVVTNAEDIESNLTCQH